MPPETAIPLADPEKPPGSLSSIFRRGPSDPSHGTSSLLASQPPIDGGSLDDEQVVTCANVLLYAALSPPAAQGLWVTDLQDLHTKMQGVIEASALEDLRSWLRQQNVLVYVVACVNRYGRIQTQGGGHWICYAIDTPSPPRRCTVTVYDPHGEEHVNLDDLSEGTVAMAGTQAAHFISSLKYESSSVPRVDLVAMRVNTRDLQNDYSADCGFHCALFILKDAVGRSKRRDVALRRELARLRTCATSARELRGWLVKHASGFNQPCRSFGTPPDRKRATAALRDLCTSVHRELRGSETCVDRLTDTCTVL
jgi:hypothetical protein